MLCTEAISQLQQLLAEHGDQEFVTEDFCTIHQIAYAEFGPSAMSVEEAERLLNDPTTPKTKRFYIEPETGR